MDTEALVPSRLQAWIMATRPKTLTAAVVPVVVASALSLQSTWKLGPTGNADFPWQLGVFALTCALLIQIGTNLINDACDYIRGADTEDRLGPTRAVASGSLSFNAVWRAGIVCFAAAILVSIPLVVSAGFPIVLIGVLSIVAGYLYTGGPRPLAYSGLGELFVIIFFGWVAVSGLQLLYCRYVSTEALLAGTQIGLLATTLIAINNLRDYHGDLSSNKLTLAVRFGIRWGRMEIALTSFLPFLLSFVWLYFGYRFPAILPWLCLPLAITIVKGVISTEPSRQYNQYLERAALLHLVFGFLLSVGLLLDLM